MKDNDRNTSDADVKPPALLQQGRITQLNVGQSGRYNHFFGGKNDLEIADFPHGEHPLHRVFSLDLADPRLGFSMNKVTQLPLLYGFVFDGCELQYSVLSNTSIKILNLVPQKSSSGWPYPEYPAHFDRLPIEIGSSAHADDEAINTLTWWNFDVTKPNDVWVNVPSSAGLGVLLWGPDGDAQGVEVVFRIDPVALTVRVRNECS